MARQDTEEESFMAKERGNYRQDCKTELGEPGVAYLDFPAAVCRFDFDSR